MAMPENLNKNIPKYKTRIKVVGIGGAGNNTINRLMDANITGIETIALNTDAQDLLHTVAHKKILIGAGVTGGLGAGSDPKRGEEAAQESEVTIRNSLTESDLVFITCGMGGGTGTGAASIVANSAKKNNALVIGIVTTPFEMEGEKRNFNSQIGLQKLQIAVDTLIVIPNQKLLELVPDVPLQTAFKVADEILINAVKGISELVNKNGLVNLDFADLKSVMSSGGLAIISLGEADGENRAETAINRALNSPLVDFDVSTSTGALININAGPDFTLAEAENIVRVITSKMQESAKIIWGVQISKDMQGTIRVLLVLTGVSSPQLFGPTSTMKDKEKTKMKKELGIQFIKNV
jgi:cell division protein FtsZ